MRKNSMLWTSAAVAAAAIMLCGTSARAADEPVAVVEPESQWEKFKDGAKIAGEAVVQGTKNTAGKVADGADRAGDAIAEKYGEAKAYVQEKIQ